MLQSLHHSLTLYHIDLWQEKFTKDLNCNYFTNTNIPLLVMMLTYEIIDAGNSRYLQMIGLLTCSLIQVHLPSGSGYAADKDCT